MEHPLSVIKCRFGLVKVRLRGLRKNTKTFLIDHDSSLRSFWRKAHDLG